MEIHATMKATFGNQTVKYNADADALVMVVPFTVAMTQGQLQRVLGKSIASAAFDGLSVDDGGRVRWGYKTMVPDAKCSLHIVDLADDEGELIVHELRVFPEVKSIKPAAEEQKVVVSFALPVAIHNASIAGALAMRVATVVTVAIQPAQMSIPTDVYEPDDIGDHEPPEESDAQLRLVAEDESAS